MSRAMLTSPTGSSQATGSTSTSTSPRNTSQSSSSSFFDRFSRRPRTSGGTPINDSSRHSNESLNFFPPENNVSPSRRHRPMNGNSNSPSGLPRSSSSSHVHLDREIRPYPSSSNANNSTSAGIGFPSSSSFNNPSSSQSPNASKRSNLGLGGRSRPSTANAADNSNSNSDREREILAAGPGGSGGGPSSPNAVGGGNPFGRMFRRYSQGAGKNNSAGNEARAIAVASNQNRVASASQVSLGNSSSPETPRRPTSGRAVTSPPPTSPSFNSNLNGNNNNGVQTQSNGLTPNISNSASTTSGIPNSQTLAVISDGQDSSNATSSSNNQDSSNSNQRSSDSNPPSRTSDSSPSGGNGGDQSSSSPQPASNEPTLHRIRLVPHLEASRSLHFEPIERNLAEGATAIKIGRFTDRAGPNNVNVAPATSVAGVTDLHLEPAAAQLMSSLGGPSVPPPATNNNSSAGGGNATSTNNTSNSGGGGRIESARVAFKSKVVSRGHAELWCEPGGKFFIRDTRSSSGTFLNHIRLSAPSVESRPFALKDGDVVQLGVDYQGGTEEIYRCVKMRVELNRGWQRGRNEFNVNAMRQIRALQGTGDKPEAKSTATTAAAAPAQRHSMSVTDCCICLFSVTVCQSLFIAPCSHVFHYKCIRPLLVMHHPGFSCPLCRTFADLEADVEQDEEWQQALVKETIAAEQSTTNASTEPITVAAATSATGEASEASPPSLAEAEAAGTSQAAAVLLAAEAQQTGEENSSSSTPIRSRREVSEATARGSVLGVPSHIRTNTDWSRPDTAVSSASTARPGYFGSGTTTTTTGSGAAAAASHQLGVRNSEGGRETPPLDSPGLRLEEEEEEGEDEEELEVPSDLASDQQGSSSSRPIAIERTASNMTATDLGTRFGSPESSTPMNDTFFSTLAETSVSSARGANGRNPSQSSKRQANLLQPMVGDTSTSSSSSNSQSDLNGNRRDSETSNQDEAFHTGEHSPSSDSPLANNPTVTSLRQNQPLPRPPTEDTEVENHDLSTASINNRPAAAKGKATERRSASSASSSSNKRIEINQEDSKRDSIGSASGSAGSSQGTGTKLSKFLKKAIN